MKKPSRRDACPLTSDGKAKVPERNADIVAYAREWIVNRMSRECKRFGTNAIALENRAEKVYHLGTKSAEGGRRT